MKILILKGVGATQYVRRGYANALVVAGHEVLTWEPAAKPTFDVFAEYDAELVICGTWELDRAIMKCLLARPYLKVMLWANNFGCADKDISREDTVSLTTENELRNTELLRDNLDVSHVFTYYAPRCVKFTHDKWEAYGLTPIGLPLAADLVEYSPARPLAELACDVSFVGGYWPYKAINLNKYLLPLCSEDKIRTKIFGYGAWPVAQYLGQLDQGLMASLFRSSVVNLNIFEPLAARYGVDVNERAYKILACGGFCLCEYNQSAVQDIFPNGEVDFFTSPAELKEKVLHYISNPQDRTAFIRKGNAAIRERHTYYHRAIDMLKTLRVSEGITKLEELTRSLL